MSNVVRRNSKMFDRVTRTWNPCIIYPCYFNCIYCWTRYFIEKKLLNSPAGKLYRQYYGKPTLIEERLKVRFREGEFVFVQDVGDLFAPNVPDEYIIEVFRIIARNRHATFLLLTKNPRRYLDYVYEVDLLLEMDNVLLGTTIETDNTWLYLERKISKAPAPDARIAAMLHLRMIGFRNLFISIEPVIDFNLKVFAEHLVKIEPAIVYVGYDNYGILRKLKIPEPPLNKTLELIDILKQHGIEVRTKTLRKAWNE